MKQEEGRKSLSELFKHVCMLVERIFIMKHRAKHNVQWLAIVFEHLVRITFMYIYRIFKRSEISLTLQ